MGRFQSLRWGVAIDLRTQKNRPSVSEDKESDESASSYHRVELPLLERDFAVVVVIDLRHQRTGSELRRRKIANWLLHRRNFIGGSQQHF